MTTLLDLIESGAVRASDPPSSHVAAAMAPVVGQRAKILDLLATLERDWGAGVTTADDLARRFPESERGTWSTRLSAMWRDGLLVAEGYRVKESRTGQQRRVRAFMLSELGRVEAARLVHPSTVTP